MLLWYVAVSVLCSTSILLLFKGLSRQEVPVSAVLTLNYALCVLLGFLLQGGEGIPSVKWFPSWWPLTMVQGAIMGVNFYLLAATAKHCGVTIASLSSRLAVAIPVVVAIPLFDEQFSLPLGFGVLLTLVALTLATMARKEARLATPFVFLPFVVFCLFGMHFVVLKWAQHAVLRPDEYHHYLMLSFCFAGLVSLAVTLHRHRGFNIFASKKLWASGLLLGAVNYGAILTLTMALNFPGTPSSVLFPTVSVSVVMLSALGGRILFQESLVRRQWWGLVSGVGAVILLNW